uniref:Reverse transcriptase domain-containing protein n=1 Tax=Tanacetum cinerariifolium TaxID=118510 RepID=A0A6L2JJ90_TANCI|nr:reverse transcriptase domain-containing protein [Tanacetum cinerariifolium]
MQTRSSSRLTPDQSSNPTSSTNTNPKGRNRRSSKQRVEDSNLEEQSHPVVTMADNRTMAEMLCAPIEGYAEAIVVPSILAEQFELKHSLINLMTTDQSWEWCGGGGVEGKTGESGVKGMAGKPVRSATVHVFKRGDEVLLQVWGLYMLFIAPWCFFVAGEGGRVFVEGSGSGGVDWKRGGGGKGAGGKTWYRGEQYVLFKRGEDKSIFGPFSPLVPQVSRGLTRNGPPT